MKISVVTPIYNEEGNVGPFMEELFGVLKTMGSGRNYEVIAVDDGSRDDSLNELKAFVVHEKNLKIIAFRGNFGQTAALSAGIEAATGDVIVPIDSDRENDPRDIPKLLAKIDEGYDVVSGWRENRWQGARFTRRIPSMVANWLISRITGVSLHDYGCTLKAYRSDVLKDVPLYGEMHRFIPALAKRRGAHLAEVAVNHRPRQVGDSKYNFSRTYKVLLDLLVIKFLDRYMTKPIHFFGGLGFISFFLGTLAGMVAVFLKLTHARDFVSTPLPTFAALLLIVGVQLIALGIVGEVLMRTYYESQNKKPYVII